ncbi:3,4-dihydroxy-2-butanone-4-phosphate synthase [Ktedonosporobacter rubrisoli]|uniref:GTP cyclohydrolase-2 n=2 Tax=Ktedonosporobacter rubrisoli TaxID=2509675 RepID=A0A4P6K661_KTERU|nr:3,4-dihydroxy-2-butanone-4-phosphate synthase [Ktedonosporobacter rubrisoli]
MVLICDDEDRENEADLCLPAQFVTPEAVNFLAHTACGLICVALPAERLEALHLPLTEVEGNPLQGTAFTTSVDARHNTTTGISAHDRAVTIRALVDPTTQPADLARPGHVFPLRARQGGTLERRGHTEASVDLMRIAGLEPAAVICEVLDEDGEAARGEKLFALARQRNIGMITVEAIARYRQEHRIVLVSKTELPTDIATFQLQDYLELASGQHYLALILGDLRESSTQPPLLRLHSACTTGDIFGSRRCDCQAQMQAALQAIAEDGRGMLLYLPQEGRGIGLSAKLQAYTLQDHGYDTLDANEKLGYPVDARSYATALDIIRHLGITHARLMTNNPRKLQAFTEAGLNVERVALETSPTEANIHYLRTKQQRLGHMFTLQPQAFRHDDVIAKEGKYDKASSSTI